MHEGDLSGRFGPDDEGAVTAEYAIATIAAVGFAALLVVVLRSDEVRGLPVNTGLIIHSERGSALGRVTRDGQYRLVRGDREVFGLHGRSAEQRIAIDLLLDPGTWVEYALLADGERGGL